MLTWPSIDVGCFLIQSLSKAYSAEMSGTYTESTTDDLAPLVTAFDEPKVCEAFRNGFV